MWDLIVSVPDHCFSFYFSCIDNAFRIWSFSADFYFDIKTPKKKNMHYFCVRV